MDQVKILTSYVVVRLRGPIDTRKDIDYTMRLLHLHRKFNATIIPDNEVSLGMLQKAKDYIAWGPAKPNLVRELLLKRGRLVGGRSVTEDYLAQKTHLESEEEVFNSIASGALRLKDLEGLKPVFRLHPPRGGFKKSTKKSVSMGGETGFREDISSIVLKMI